ncbi:hypothetical protein PR048_026322 [Dryococelus australis]|uniref:Uncharacterized protein n=1 Tax=Dryococelus australis TaxID=614101 RepID=A0ABQ9GL35_9NEOP|nr:hypothetical protein PR048_026322 [Dryococelus australis]
MADLSNRAYLDVATMEKALSGFRAAEVFPLNREKFIVSNFESSDQCSNFSPRLQLSYNENENDSESWTENMSFLQTEPRDTTPNIISFPVPSTSNVHRPISVEEISPAPQPALHSASNISKGRKQKSEKEKEEKRHFSALKYRKVVKKAAVIKHGKKRALVQIKMLNARARPSRRLTFDTSSSSEGEENVQENLCCDYSDVDDEESCLGKEDSCNQGHCYRLGRRKKRRANAPVKIERSEREADGLRASGWVWTSAHLGSGSPNRIRLEIASEKQSSNTREIPYDRVKRCRERKINIKASERINTLVYEAPVEDVGSLRNRIVAGCETIRNFQEFVNASGCPCNDEFSRNAASSSSNARLHHHGLKLDPRSDLRSTQTTVIPFEFRAGLGIEMKFISNPTETLWFEISIRDHREPDSGAEVARWLENPTVGLQLTICRARDFCRADVTIYLPVIGVPRHLVRRHRRNTHLLSSRIPRLSPYSLLMSLAAPDYDR